MIEYFSSTQRSVDRIQLFNSALLERIAPSERTELSILATPNRTGGVLGLHDFILPELEISVARIDPLKSAVFKLSQPYCNELLSSCVEFTDQQKHCSAIIVLTKIVVARFLFKSFKTGYNRWKPPPALPHHYATYMISIKPTVIIILSKQGFPKS